MRCFNKIASCFLSFIFVFNTLAVAETEYLISPSIKAVEITSHQNNSIVYENRVKISGICSLSDCVSIYVDGKRCGEAICENGSFEYSVSDLEDGRRNICVQTENEYGLFISDSVFINIVTKRNEFLGDCGDVQNFDLLPEWNELSADESRLSDLKSNFNFAIYSNTLSVSRTQGASGRDGDYALYVEKPKSLTDGTKASLIFGNVRSTPLAESGKLTLNFDIKLNNSESELRFFKLPLWHSGHSLVSGGKLTGTDVLFPENKWVNLCMVYDMSNSKGDYQNGKWYVTLSYENNVIKAIDGLSAVPNVFHNGTQIDLQLYGGTTTNTEPIGFALDNFSLLYEDENIYAENIKSTGNLNNEKTIYNIIPADTEKLLFTMSRETDATADDIIIYVDNEVFVPLSVVTDNRNIIIELPKLKKNKILTIVFKNEIGYVTDDIIMKFYVADENGYYADLRYSDTSCKFKLVSSNFNNNNSSVIIAHYKDNELLRVKCADIDAKTEFYTDDILCPEYDTIKAFVFESSQSINPLIKCVEAVPEEQNTEFLSYINDDFKVKSLLGNDVVFMTETNTLYTDGVKTTTMELGFKSSITHNGVFMVDVNLAKDVLNDASGVVPREMIYKYDGAEYLPLEDYAEFLSKNVYTDNRGFIIVSDNNHNFSNSDLASEKFEDTDIIYRYMQFDRPDATELYDDMRISSGNSRPRLFIKKDDIPHFRQKINADSDIKSVLDELLSKCDSYMDKEPIEYVIPDGIRLFESCDAVKKRLIDLGVAYMATGDTKYANRAWIEIENALNWKDWNVDMHFLDSGEIGPGVAFAYDVFYDCFTKEQKDFIRKRVEELYINFAVGVYTGESSFLALDNRMVNSNWGAVCSASMLLCALSFMGEEPRESQLMQKCEFLAENAIRSLEIPLGNLDPDGACGEGMGYWEYYITHLGWSINALRNMCGSDYGLLSSPGYNKTVDYMIHMHSPYGVYNYGDENSTRNYYPPEAVLIPKFNNNYEQMALIEAYRKALGVSRGAQWLMWYENTEESADFDSFPTDMHFKGEQVIAMRSSWEKNAAYVGIRGGVNNVASHFDKGSFIYDDDGVRWFIETGRDNYNMPGGYYGANGHTVYKKRAEGHNCLVINPTAPNPGQNITGATKLIKMQTEKNGAIALLDLKDI